MLVVILKDFDLSVGNALVMLLQNSDLLPSPSQRLAAVLLLYELFKSETPSSHPFSSVFVQLLVNFTCLTMIIFTVNLLYRLMSRSKARKKILKGFCPN